MPRLARLLAFGLLLPFLVVPVASAEPVDPRSPTVFLNSETSRTLPDGFGYVAAGAGLLLGDNSNGPNAGQTNAGLNYARGVGGRGELRVHAGLGLPGSVNNAPPPVPIPDLGLGYKYRLGPAGAFDAALNGYTFYSRADSVHTYGFLLSLPLSHDTGSGEFVLQPRVIMPDLAHGASNLAAGVQFGYRWDLSPSFHLMGELTPSVSTLRGPRLPFRVGMRYSPLTTLHIDLGLGQDPGGVALNLADIENFTLASLTLRYGL